MKPDANITARKRTWVVVLTGIASMMAALDTVVVSTALSTVRVHLHASVGQLEWTVNAYNLSFAVLLMTATALGDRFGRKRMFAMGLGLFSAASAACALSPDPEDPRPVDAVDDRAADDRPQRDRDSRHRAVPPDAITSRRLETLTLGVLGQLGATANWHRIMGELLEGGAPADELGQQEAAFFGR